MAYFYLTAVMAARERIAIATPYFIPDGPLLRAIQVRARAGVSVRLLLPGPETDNPWGRLSTQRHYESLMDAGVEIHEYQPTFLHSKFLVIDGAWSIVGSPNLNSRSRHLDEENALGIYDDEFGTTLKATFFKDLERAKPVNLEEWRRRNPLQKFFETISRILDQQS